MALKQITSSKTHPGTQMKVGEWRFSSRARVLFHKFGGILHEFWTGESLRVDGSNKMLNGTRLNAHDVYVRNHLGVGTTTTPHGGVGYAKVAIEGANASASGPHVQYTTASDDYPLFQQLNWAHDNIQMMFDAYYNGAYKSSDAGSNARIHKNADLLMLQYDSGVAQGATITWNNSLVMDLTTGYIGVNTVIPATTFQNVGTTRLGDQATNYTQVEADGDVLFVGGGGLQYGEIFASDNAIETAIAVANTWYQVTIFDTDGLSNGSVIPDHTNDHITVGAAGHYMVHFSASVLSAAGAAFDGEFEVKKNNGVTDLTNVHTDRDLAGGGGDHGSISMNGIIDCAANDTIELWIRNKTNTTNVIFEDVTLSIVQIGGT